MKYHIEIIIFSVTAVILYVIYTQFSEKNIILNYDTDLPETIATKVEVDELIRGSPVPSKLYIVEYIDLQCPHCKSIHPNLKEYVQTSPRVLNGEVSWVARHGPHIDEISTQKSETVECIKKYNGNAKAWDFIDQSILATEELEYPLKRYRQIFNTLDIEPEKIFNCLRTKETSKKVDAISDDVERLQINKTPYIQILTPNGELLDEQFGPLTLEQIQTFVEETIKRIE